MPIMDAVKSVLSGVATPFEHPVQTASAIGNEAQKLGNDLVSNAGRPAPTYSVDPTTGQMQTQQGPATKGNFFKSMLTGALLGLASGAGADNPAAAFGAGAGGVIRNNQQQDQLARQQATQDYQTQLTAQQNQRDVAAANDLHKLQQLRIVDQGARNTSDALQGKINQWQLDHQGMQMAQQYEDTLRKADYSPVAHADSVTDLHSLVEKNPEYAGAFARGEIAMVPTYDPVTGTLTGVDAYLAKKPTGLKVPWRKTARVTVPGIGDVTLGPDATLGDILQAGSYISGIGLKNAQKNWENNRPAPGTPRPTADALGKLRALQAEGLAKTAALQKNPRYYSSVLGKVSDPEGLKTATDLLNAEYSKKAEAIAPGGWAVLHAAEAQPVAPAASQPAAPVAHPDPLGILK